MRGDGWTDQCSLQLLEIGPRPLGISAHQTSVVGDIRHHHRRQSPFHALAGQSKGSSGSNDLPRRIKAWRRDAG
jgi:hypothetical protein